MSEEFDKRLKDHITDVFDNYEGSSADAGWALLREKYPEKDKKRPVAWWWFGAAAGLLLILGTALWLNTAEKAPQVLKQTTGTKLPHRDTNTSHTVLQPSTTTNPGKAASTNRADTGVELAGTRNTRQNNRGIAARITYFKHHRSTPAVASSKENSSIIDKDEQVEPLIANTNTSRPLTTTDTAKIGTGIAANNKQIILSKTDTAAGIKTDPTAGLKKAIASTDQPKTTRGKKLTWSAFVSAYSNFASGSNSNFNQSAGFGTDIPLGNSFNLSTGLGLFQNTFSYNPTSGGKYYTVPSGSYSYVTTTYSANLLALEIPLKLDFKISKGGNYLSTGVSSALFITETYFQQNNLSPTATTTPGGVSQAAQQDVSTTTHFNTFAFAKTLDFSAAIGYPIGKNKIILEPFVKIPFNSLGRSDLRYGSIGTSLRFAFGTGK
jgi:hypothetical protein